MEPKYFNKQVLILVSSHQNSGKSTFCRNLCPPFLDGYVAENVNPGSKDSLIALASNFIINLDELHQFSRADINVLKSWVSQSEISVRLPYAKKSTNMPRYASFVGSTNMSEFLYDETGSVRWLCFKVLSIDFNYNNTYTNHREIAIDNVWAQAYELYKSGFQAEMDSQEIADNEGPNKSFIHLPPEFEMLPNYFEPSNDQEGNFMTSTDIMNYIQPYTNYKLYPMRIGRALSYYGFEKVMHNKLKRYGYWVTNLK